jgi:hypothetical protein
LEASPTATGEYQAPRRLTLPKNTNPRKYLAAQAKDRADAEAIAVRAQDGDDARVLSIPSGTPPSESAQAETHGHAEDLVQAEEDRLVADARAQAVTEARDANEAQVEALQARLRRNSSSSPAAVTSPIESETMTQIPPTCPVRPDELTGTRGTAAAGSDNRGTPSIDQVTEQGITAIPIKSLDEVVKHKKKEKATTIGPPEIIPPPQDEVDYLYGNIPLPDCVPYRIEPLGKTGGPVPYGQAAAVLDMSGDLSSDAEGGRMNPFIPESSSGDEAETGSVCISETGEDKMATAIIQNNPVEAVDLNENSEDQADENETVTSLDDLLDEVNNSQVEEDGTVHSSSNQPDNPTPTSTRYVFFLRGPTKKKTTPKKTKLTLTVHFAVGRKTQSG